MSKVVSEEPNVESKQSGKLVSGVYVMAGYAQVTQKGWIGYPVFDKWSWVDVRESLYDLEGNPIYFPPPHYSTPDELKVRWIPENKKVRAWTFDAMGTGLYVLEDEDTIFTCPANYLDYFEEEK